MLDVAPLNGTRFETSAAKLAALNDADKRRAQRERSRNALEGFVLEMTDKIYSAAYDSIVSQEEREKIGKACSDVSDWLYEDGSDAAKEVYDEKFKGLKLMTKEIEDRAREHKDRPDALDALEKMINISRSFLDSSKSLPEDQQYFTATEVSTLDKLLTETLEWREKKMKAQAETPLTQAPALTVRMIAEKIDALDREVKYMVNKARVNKLNKQKEEGNKNKEEDPAGEKVNKTVPGGETVENEVKQESSGDKADDKKTEETINPSEPQEEKHTEL